MRRVITAAVFLAALIVAWWIWPREVAAPAVVGHGPQPRPAVSYSGSGDKAPPQTKELAEDYPIAAALNAENSTISRDLDILSQVFDAWRTSFVREGNPVGENSDITSALCGANPLGLVLIPRNHRAINANGELCDRWGTPFRFHQLSGERMEIRSAGPDRRFATPDDAVWSPQ